MVEVWVDEETTKQVQELGKMTLLDRITLLDKPEWTSPLCNQCGKKDPKHMELDCPKYKWCSWCKQSGSFGFIRKHKCQYIEEQETAEDWKDFWASTD
jgi:hypothetical protein